MDIDQYEDEDGRLGGLRNPFQSPFLEDDLAVIQEDINEQDTMMS